MAFVIDEPVRQQILERNPEANEIIKPYLGGRDVRRYAISFNGKYLIYTHRGISLEKYPAVENHLRRFKNRLQSVQLNKLGMSCSNHNSIMRRTSIIRRSFFLT